MLFKQSRRNFLDAVAADNKLSIVTIYLFV